jgi:hypothetical protein
MPVGFSSPSRNLFLLGSSGEQVVTNFFKAIDQSLGTDGVYLPDEIRYNFLDQKYILSGSASDSNSRGFGWIEKRDVNGTAEWSIRVERSQAGINTTLRAMELDVNDNLIVVGKTGSIPWIAKYSNGGVINWQSTTSSANVEYTGVASDSGGNYYACGNTPLSGDSQAFVEKFSSSGTPVWSKSSVMLGRDVVLNKIAANTRGQVVAVGYLEDDTANKGYIVKIDTNTGEILWDKTLSTREYGSNFANPLVVTKDCICLGVYIDINDQIYVCGYKANIDTYDVGFVIKYTAEGNMIWQKEMRGFPTAADIGDGVGYRFTDVKADGETEQVVVLSQSSVGLGGSDISLYKFSKNGDVVFRRRLTSDRDGPTATSNSSLDADPSFYYLLFTDQEINGLNGTPDKYTFGKVSSSGNGLGAFEYTSDVGVTIDYTYGENTGYLSIVDGVISDGSIRNDTSDLKTYPFSANKLLFDDLATQVSNKKRQMDSADSFEYGATTTPSGSSPGLTSTRTPA